MKNLLIFLSGALAVLILKNPRVQKEGKKLYRKSKDAIENWTNEEVD